MSIGNAKKKSWTSQGSKERLIGAQFHKVVICEHLTGLH